MGELNIRTAVRALLVDEDDRLLLLRFEFPGASAWALPGGGLEPGESYEDGLHRELHEELGLTEVEIGPHIWNRLHVIPILDTDFDGQRDHIRLVRVEHFEPQPTIGWDAMRARVHEMRWWSLDDIASARDIRFAPRRLAEFYAQFLAEGPPTDPFETGV